MKTINKFTICLLITIVASLTINMAEVYAEAGTGVITEETIVSQSDNNEIAEVSVDSTTESTVSEPALTTEPASTAEPASTTDSTSKVVLSGSSVTAYALKFVGNPYRYGGTSLTKGTDCSGFVMSVYKKFGYKLPHSSSAMRKVGKKVSSLSKAKPGDIICYSGHVAIYLGNNKIVHASTKKTGIKISNNAKYKKIITIRRLIY